MEKKFYFKWEDRRERGRLYNMVIGGLKSFISMVIIVLGSQYVVNGRSPYYIMSILSTNEIVVLIVITLVFSIASGILYWYECEKRYKSISRKVGK